MTKLRLPGSSSPPPGARNDNKSLRRRAFGLRDEPKPALRFGPLQARKALLYAARSRTFVRLFLGSSAVEHSTVNRMVAGSNPARGAKIFHFISKLLPPPRSDAPGLHLLVRTGKHLALRLALPSIHTGHVPLRSKR